MATRSTKPTFESLEQRLMLNGVISGTVWDDFNGDGVRDANEPGLDGQTVQLVDITTGTVAASQVTTDLLPKN
jgi:hypothetical protein